MTHRRAFTLTETLAAMALTAMLVAVGLNVVSSLSRSAAGVSAPDRTDAFHGWRSQLMRDLATGDIRVGSATELQLTSFDGLVGVTWSVRQFGRYSWLIRKQEVSGILNTRLVSPDVEALRVVAVSAGGYRISLRTSDGRQLEETWVLR